jgi:two-component system response regulator FlrC
VDIRLLATSNRDLEEEVRQGNFREDLFFRLNVVNLELPPLRERRGDIEVLAKHFIEKYARANGVQTPALGGEARAMLLDHPWRGNVRELENTMHRAVLLAQGGVITPESILLRGRPDDTAEAKDDGAPADDRVTAAVARSRASMNSSPSSMVGRTVADVERDLILDTLQHTLGNRTHAANILGISIRTLRNKLKLYSQEGIPVPMPGEAERSSA